MLDVNLSRQCRVRVRVSMYEELCMFLLDVVEDESLHIWMNHFIWKLQCSSDIIGWALRIT